MKLADPLKSSSVLNDAEAIANTAYRVSQAVAKTSVTRLTKDQVFQFPVFMDASIDDDEQYPIIKSIEKNYAQLVMMAITNNGFIDRDRYADVNQFLRKFHNNSGIPAIPSSITEAVVTEAILTESALSDKDNLALQGTIEDRLDTSSINDMYKPYGVTEAKLNRAIEAANEQRRRTAALEADAVYYRRAAWARGKDGKPLRDNNGQYQIMTDKNGNPMYQYFTAIPDANNPDAFKKMTDLYGAPQTLAEWSKIDANAKANIEFDAKKIFREEEQLRRLEDRAYADAKAADAEARQADERRRVEALQSRSRVGGNVVNDSKYANLAPTVINLTLANTKKDIGAWSQNIIIGVKAVARLIPQSLMVSNMVDACKNRAIFNFIKWTNHELKFFDLLFGVSSARSNARGDNRWMRVLKRRASRSRIPGAKINPNTTIIITESDVHYVQEQCGVNLGEVSNVRKIIDKYFLLGFGIYDTEGKMLKIIYDGEDEFTQQSMRSLMADAKKEANLLAMNRY